MAGKIIENAGVKFYANTYLEKWRAEIPLKKSRKQLHG
jgi:hypothetical protein